MPVDAKLPRIDGAWRGRLQVPENFDAEMPLDGFGEAMKHSLKGKLVDWEWALCVALQGGLSTVPHPGECELATFDLDRIDRVLASAEGEYDGAHWMAVVHLADGRYAFITAGCSFSGWGSFGDNGRAMVSATFVELLQFALTPDERGTLCLLKTAPVRKGEPPEMAAWRSA